MEDTSIKKSTVITTIIVLLIIVGGTWGWFRYKNSSPEPTVAGETADNSETVRITAKHQFKNGKHIVAGSVDLPTPCYVLDTQAMIAESYPEQVTLNFTATTSDEMCTQVVTTERFKVDFTASEGAVIKATWNGKPAILNLIPAGENEDLNNFELFIKG